MTYENARIISSPHSNAHQGQVKLNPAKASWVMLLVASSLFVPVTFSWPLALAYLITTATVLCLGHSLGMHRKLIHNSYQCPKWLEYTFVHLGTLVGLAGPIGMIRTHDMRDWAQRQNQCHDYFGHKQPWYIDIYWQLCCDIHLRHPPTLNIEAEIQNNSLYQWMEKTWVLQQLPCALLCFALAGFEALIWCCALRTLTCILGHWLIGYFAHNKGQQHWHIQHAAVQGFNIPFTSFITFGESHHNNHHAFPQSAKFSLKTGELDPGWWVLQALQAINLASNFVIPEYLPARKERVPVATNANSTHTTPL